MQSQQNITIYLKHNFSQATLAVIEDTNRLNIVIDDIKADRAISIEIKQFFSICDVFKHLSQKRKQVIQQLSQIDDYKQRKVLNDELEKFDEEEKQYRINILLTANNFTNIKHTEVLQEVADLFFEGNTQDACKRLNPKGLETEQGKTDELSKNSKELEKTRDRLEDNANEFKIKAQLNALNLEIEKAEDRFQKSIFYFEKGYISAEYSRRNNVIAGYSFTYGRFLHNYNQYDEAQKKYEKSLSVFSTMVKRGIDAYLLDFAMINHNLGIIHSDKNEYTISCNYLETSLNALKKLNISEKETDLSLLISIYSNLANVQRLKKEYKKSEQTYKKTIRETKKLIKIDSKSNMHFLSTAYNDLGVLYKEQGKSKDAQENYITALSVISEYKDDDFYLPYISVAFNNLGELYRMENKLQEAKDMLTKALYIYEKLQSNEPRKYSPNVAGVLNNLGVLYEKNENYEIAEEKYNQALEIYKELTRVNKSIYLPFVAKIYNNLAVLYVQNNRIKLAQISFEKVIELKLEIVNDISNSYQPELAVSLLNTSVFYYENSSNLNKARELAEKALLITNKFNTVPIMQSYSNKAKLILKEIDKKIKNC